MKKVLITAGTVYGRLDDNKLVGNRVRGIWATHFAAFLSRKGHDVTLLVSDIQASEIKAILRDKHWDLVPAKSPTIVTHTGFWNYQGACFEFAKTHDAAVMAAAVVNWIPETPFPGKMPTVGVGDRMMVPFILAPRVIDEMRKINPKIALIGCKMTIGEMKPKDVPDDGIYTADECPLFEIAYKSLLQSRCNVVVANDMKAGLKTKYLVYPDRSTIPYTLDEQGHFRTRPWFTDMTMYEALEAVITDEHFHTETGVPWGLTSNDRVEAARWFDRLVDKFRPRFTKRYSDSEHVFGAVAVRMKYGAALVSPREKGQMFSSEDAVIAHLSKEHDRTVFVDKGKASLNAPLLLRHLETFPEAVAVVHFHEELVPTKTEYHAPPGTARDNLRVIPDPTYTIAGHGCIIAIDKYGQPLSRTRSEPATRVVDHSRADDWGLGCACNAYRAKDCICGGAKDPRA